MDLLAAIKREERKLERQLGKLQKQFNGLRAAAKALGDSTIREVAQVKKRVLSAAAKAKDYYDLYMLAKHFKKGPESLAESLKPHEENGLGRRSFSEP